MVVKFFDLTEQTKQIYAEINTAINIVLTRGNFILGEEVQLFEQEFAAYCGVAEAVGVASGTDALQIALRGLGIGHGDEVITTAHTAVATVAAIVLVGARPTLIDIDPLRYTMDPEQIKAAITPATRAVIPVHLYGCPADLDPILSIAKRYGLWVVEDCAQAHGARYRGTPVGAWGTVSAFSFYPTKNLGAYGSAGAVLTNDPGLAERMRWLRSHGWQERYISQIKGMNSCLDELQAAILRVKLRHLEQWNAQRRNLAAVYKTGITNHEVVLPYEPDDVINAYHLFVIRHQQRNNLRGYLQSKGIGTLVHYPLPVHLQPAYYDLGYHHNSLPECEKAASEVLSLPLYPELTEEQVSRVIQAINIFNTDPD